PPPRSPWRGEGDARSTHTAAPSARTSSGRPARASSPDRSWTAPSAYQVTKMTPASPVAAGRRRVIGSPGPRPRAPVAGSVGFADRSEDDGWLATFDPLACAARRTPGG